MNQEPLTKKRIKVIPKEKIEKIIESKHLITIVFKDGAFKTCRKATLNDKLKKELESNYPEKVNEE